ncbi:amidase family protein [Mesorhizobium sp. M0976]|uniref:amidase family protein n=1 Tax=Mesorhizobium sp. M0976 TaxID=2957038 RepID=UPI00333A08B2
MVRISNGSHRVQGGGAFVGCDGGLPSDPLKSAELVEPGSQNGLTNKSPYKVQSMPIPFEICEATIPELQVAMASGRVTSQGVVSAYLARIEAYDRKGPCLNAVIRLNQFVYDAAAALDDERRAGRVRGPMHGVPIILKDNFATSEMPASAGCSALAKLWPRNDAFQVKKMREAGAVILGKASMDDLAETITGTSSLGGQTRNPYDLNRIPGGSSGGSGVAAAVSLAAIAYGTDTAGSIRIPAAYNNLFALRPTKGLSSNRGIIPYSHTHDTAGPLARTVIDLAVGLDVTVGPDPADPRTRGAACRVPSFIGALDAAALKGARLGIVGNFFREADDAEAMGVVEAAVKRLKECGAVTLAIELPTPLEVADGVVWDYEFRSDLADYLAAIPSAPVSSLSEILSQGLFNPKLREQLQHANTSAGEDSPEYRLALARREGIQRELLSIFNLHGLDALAYPTLRSRPPLIGSVSPKTNTSLSAVTGFPAMAIPAGFTSDNLPIGMELLGRPLGDHRLVALAYAYEQAVRPRRSPNTTPPLGASSFSQ